jgi:NAD(P)H dehydrogenase (quinone)
MRIAVTGGTGRVGGRVVQLLGETGRHEVVALSSRTAPYDDPSALRAALDGVETLVFVSSDGEAARIVVHHRNVLEAADRCGIGHIVLLSGLDAALDSPFCYAFTNGDTERLLRAAGRPHSIVRASLFAECFLSLMRQVSTGDVVGLPAADGHVSLVTREDVAQCLAALALSEPTDRHHDVTGPDSLAVPAIAQAAGYRYSAITPAEFAGTLTRTGEQAWWTYAYGSMFESIRQHRWERTSNAVVELTGRPPAAASTVLARR